MKLATFLHSKISESKIEFPMKIIHPADIIKKKGFFPICTGTIDGDDDLSNKKVMIVGQDFGKCGDYNKAEKNGEDISKISTWVQLLKMLPLLGLNKGDCFFTNYLLGVRDSSALVRVLTYHTYLFLP